MHDHSTISIEPTSPTTTPCDRELIHVPGAIQAFGALLSLDPGTLKILQASVNSAEVFGKAPNSLLGKSAADLFGPETADELRAGNGLVHGEGWTGRIVRSERTLLLEAETRQGRPDSRSEKAALEALEQADTLLTLLQTAADYVQKLTNFDRVMVYRFHPDLHGEVVAEAVKEGVDQYLGLHYPASDIPAPARAVFLRTWVRMIPDVNYRPVALEPVLDPRDDQPLDLGDSLLRAVSPIHIEYLKNMAVGSSLTISLKSQGKLWGLIACHGLAPKYVDLPVRESCEAIGRITSAFIAIKDDQDLLRQRDTFRRVHRQLVENLHGSDDMAAAITKSKPNLLDLISARGGAAALYLEGYWVTAGETPSEPELEDLVTWLAATSGTRAIFTTNELPAVYPPAANFHSPACGLLAIHVPKTERNFILWFRPEIISTVKWAGKPEKVTDRNGRLHPRASFGEWTQKVGGRSIPWTEPEEAAALELRNAIMAIDLQRQFVKEQAAREDAERAMHSREELMAVLSHDLKNPIGSIKLNAHVATRFLPGDSAPNVKQYLTRIDKAATSMNSLIDDILAITKMEAGHVEMERQPTAVTELLSEVVDLLSPIANEKKISLTKDFKISNCEAAVDQIKMIQVFSNIIGNAIKFTPEEGNIVIALDRCGPELVEISITDNGPGIEPANLPYIFDRFWQANQAKRLGVGLGLAIAKGIIQRHGGTITADSDGKSGTTFRISFPPSKNPV